MQLYLYILAFSWVFSPLYQNSSFQDNNPKTLQLKDHCYEPEIKTVTLRHAQDAYSNIPQHAVTRLGNWDFILEFDDLHDRPDSYYARIIHCNRDWTKSELQDLDFLTSYNEYPLNLYEYSVDTQIPYVHYWLTLPPVKISGNYVLAIYRGEDRDDLILTKRFMVFDPRIEFIRTDHYLSGGNIASLNQQINFTIRYQNLDVNNPLENIHVYIRQNQRWDNMAQDIRPAFVRENTHELEYRFFEKKYFFKGGNEFRWFDLRSINYPGRNVASVQKGSIPLEAYVMEDRSKANDAYAQYRDLNGQFIIENLDDRDPSMSEYIDVNFSLKSPPLAGDVYVAGAFHLWEKNEDNRMSYNKTNGHYEASILLKQGWYDYQYVIESPSLSADMLEGSHFETENGYEIFIYYRSFQPHADLLVGYIHFEENRR